MFGNRAAQVTFVKTPKTVEATDATSCVDDALELIKKINKKSIIQAGAGVVAFYASVKTVDTLSTIAINYAPKH